MKVEPKEHVIRYGNSLGYGLILSVALSLGCWGSLLSMFRLPLPFAVVLGLVTCLSPVFVLLGSIRGLGRFMAFYVLLLTAMLILLRYQDVADGFLQILNQAIRSLNAAWGTGYLEYQSSGTASHLWMAFLVMVIAVSAAIGQSVAQRQPLPGFLFTAVPVLAGLVLKEQPSVWMLILLTLAWTALFLLCSGAGRLPVIAVSLVCLCVLSLLFTRSSWQPVDGLDAARQRFASWEEQLRYGGTKIDSLSKGDLTKTHLLKYDDRSVFTLQMQLGQSLYLRGFTGASYANQKWSQAEQTAYGGKYRGLMQWLEKNGYEPWCQENSIYRLLPDYTFTEVKVNNQRASSQYLWMPYETAVSGDAGSGMAKYDQDQTPRTSGFRGQREYTLHIFDSRLKEYSDAEGAQMLRSMEKQDGYSDYLKKEKLYRTFVYDRYLDVDRETAALLNTLPVQQCRGKTLDYCLYMLRNQFTKHYTYDINTKVAPKGQDALRWFLTRSKKGNSMHFSTAAALFLREAGFPTRYAEGYYLSPSQLKLYEELENVKMPVADSASHAWVEVYVDRLGWMPVEVTPGFYDMKKR